MRKRRADPWKLLPYVVLFLACLIGVVMVVQALATDATPTASPASAIVVTDPAAQVERKAATDSAEKSAALAERSAALAETSAATANWLQFLTLIVGAVTALGVPWIAYMTVKAKITNDKTQSITVQTHELVNGQKGVQLRQIAVGLRRLAVAMPGDESIKAEAAEAQAVYEEHERNRAAVLAQSTGAVHKI